jgi:hypothetical protein
MEGGVPPGGVSARCRAGYFTHVHLLLIWGCGVHFQMAIEGSQWSQSWLRAGLRIPVANTDTNP